MLIMAKQTRAMAFFFKIEYEDGTVQQFWSKPWHMAQWELKKDNVGQSFLPADGVPPMNRLYWLAFVAGREQGLFEDRLMSDWGQRMKSFEFYDAEEPDDENEETDDAAEVDGLDPTPMEA